VNAKNASGRCSGFVVVIVTEALSLGSIPDGESVMSCVRRSYDDMLKEERVTGQSPDG
jgi:hypothetical protein